MLEPDDPRRPPTIGELMFRGGGAFNHLIWQVQPTLDADSVSDSLASMHEWAHHELNNVSSYGLLLTYYAFLSRHADDNREAFAERLGQLVERCQVAHEVYATWYSVELLRTAFSLDSLLAELPDDYKAYHQQGERIVRRIDSPFLRQQAFLVVVRSCFEAAVFSMFDSERADQFRLTDIRTKDLPNSRLQFVVGSLSEDLFPRWTMEFCRCSGKSRDAEAIAFALGRTRDQAFFDLPLSQADAVLGRFLTWLTTKWNGWLEERCLSNGNYEDHLKLAPLLIDDMNVRCSKATVAHPLSATTSPHDTAAVLLQQMESEVVRIRQVPLLVDIVPVSTLAHDMWPMLPVGQPPHLLFQARTLQDVCTQHNLQYDELARHLGAAPLVFLRRREPPDDDGNESANIFLFETPDELKAIRAVTPNVKAYGFVSSSLMLDQSWMNQWLDPSILWVGKIEHSLHAFLTGHCQKQQHVRYSTSTLRDGDQILHFICFLTREADERHWGLYIGFCAEHTAKACVQFIEQKMDPARFVFDREPFEGDLAPVLQVIATHTMRDEFYLSFNQLSYS